MKTTSLELSKQLKEAGYTQNNPMFSYIAYGKEFTGEEVASYSNGFESNEFTWVAAPTAEEILERLPVWYSLTRTPDGYKCFGGEKVHGEDADKGAEAAGKMWLYLKENNLL